MKYGEKLAKLEGAWGMPSALGCCFAISYTAICKLRIFVVLDVIDDFDIPLLSMARKE